MGQMKKPVACQTIAGNFSGNQPLAFQENPHINVAASVAIGWQ